MALSGELLPPVLPIVLYNGERRWTDPQDVGELIEWAPGDLESYRPRVGYLLLEERLYEASELASMRNLVAALFCLENSRSPEDVCQVVTALHEWLRAPERSDVRHAFVGWLRQVLLPRRLPGVEVPEIEDLQEVRTLLADRVKEWTKQWRDEGRDEGRKEGEIQLLIRQLEKKFGPLEESIRQQIAAADSERLLAWGEQVLTANRLEDVFG